jgi:short-subunit dehydrogenase
MLEKKNVLITGASSGLGRALAKKFAKNGANLVLCARRSERLYDLQDELIKANPHIKIHIVIADVSDKNSSKNLVEQCMSQFSQLDVFVANAGQGMWSRFRDISDPDKINELMQVNFMGVVYGLFYSLPYLRKSSGSFIAISSIQGLIPVAYHAGYVASKYAINGLIDTLRLEEPKIHFLLALPSWIANTELREHALVGVGRSAVQVKKQHKKNVISALDCAEKIIRALTNRKKEVFIPKIYRYVPILRDVFGSTFDQLVMNKIQGQIK